MDDKDIMQTSQIKNTWGKRDRNDEDERTLDIEKQRRRTRLKQLQE